MENNDLDFKGKPVYVQIAERMMETFAEEGVKTDTRVASVRENAANMEVNINTMMRSYEMLERLGVVYNRRGVGFFVSADAPERISAYFRDEFLGKELPRIFARMRKLGFTPDQLSTLYTDYINNQNS